MKITIVGAGAVGASCAEYIALKNFASEVVLLDIKQGFAEGKSMDLMQCASLNGFDTKITGTTNDYSKTSNSNICVITSGMQTNAKKQCINGFNGLKYKILTFKIFLCIF